MNRCRLAVVLLLYCFEHSLSERGRHGAKFTPGQAHLDKKLSGLAHHQRGLAILTLLQNLNHRPVDHRQPRVPRRQDAVELLHLVWVAVAVGESKDLSLFFWTTVC